MAEKTAAQILHAQLDLEVGLAKSKVFEELVDCGIPPANSTVEAMECLAEAVCRRWWLSRMVKTPEPLPEKDSRDRMGWRMSMLAQATQEIINHSGGIENNALQMTLLGVSAEV